MPTATDMTTFGADLKEFYTLPPRRALNDKSFLHDKLTKEQGVVDYTGKFIPFPVTMRRSMGDGSRGDAGDLPDAVAEVDVQAQILMYHHYHTLEWSEVVELSSRNSAGAFEKVVTKKMKNLAIDMAKGINRQLYNDSYGALGILTDATANATHSVRETKYIYPGRKVDIVNATTGVPVTSGTNREVLSVDRVNKTITLDVSVTTTGSGNEAVVITGNFDLEIEGLRAITAAGRTLHGISDVTYEEWASNQLDATGGVISESLVEQLDDAIGERGRGDADLHLTTRGIRRRIADDMASQRRYLTEKSTDLKLGYSLVEINKVETVIDDDAPTGYFFGAKRDVLKIYKLGEPGFIESEAGTGAKVELKNGSTAGRKKAVFQAFYRYHVSLGCEDPGVTGVIVNGEDSSRR